MRYLEREKSLMIVDKKKIRPICFYLPQFHTLPENDTAYGKGFTEWSNVKKATPLFNNHNQPRVPLNMDYYCLLDEGVMESQVAMAKAYGIYGFCYYHYWFKNGKKLLEKPLEKMLQNSKIDMPFCLSWANENWTKRWDGGNNEVIVEQDYGDIEDLNHHVDYLCQFFKDNRYIKINGSPILLIYKPELIPHLKKYIFHIRKRAQKNGFSDIKLIVQYPKFILDGGMLHLFDYYVEFEPQFIESYLQDIQRNRIQRKVKKFMIDAGLRLIVNEIEDKRVKSCMKAAEKKLIHRNYDDDWENILSHPVADPKQIAGAFVDWDNTPRNHLGKVYDGVTPEKFRLYMTCLLQKIRKEYTPQLLFINAWNEWAEGTYLEPDQKNGYSYLEGLKYALENY